MAAHADSASVHSSPDAGRSYLALGDSYTIGEGIAPSQSWPWQLAARLRADGIALDDPWVIAGIGWTTDELDAAITTAQPLGTHALVSLLIGVNDQYRGRPLDQYVAPFAALLGRAIGFAGGRAGRVMVLSIPDWGVTPFGAASGRAAAGIASELDDYNVAARALCDGFGVAFVDITTLSREHGRTLCADDGLHPSAALHALWAHAALPIARKLLLP
ncbi:MAG: Lysophospholipase and related esterase [Xanthomonadaceae bacterium]|nr:Lysophospholipase and related esterase [Xanthomonadaceae bacterium]